jgi:hypothetical protein
LPRKIRELLRGRCSSSERLVALRLEEHLKESQPRAEQGGAEADDKQTGFLQEREGPEQGHGAEEHERGQDGPLEVLAPLFPEQ